jgi:predicted O-methyltransferase YrrM
MRLSEYARWAEKNGCRHVTGPRYCLNLYSFSESVQAKRILEIGTGWGFSTTALAASVGQRDGSIVTIDNEDRLDGECLKLLGRSGAEVQHIRSRFQDYTPDGLFDLIYCDVEWTAECMRECHNLFYGFLRPGGLYVVDGMFGQPGVTQFVDERSAFLPLHYSESYAHAVHRKQPWPRKPIFRHAVCRDCDWVSDSWEQEEIVGQMNDHCKALGHSATGGHFTVAARVN